MLRDRYLARSRKLTVLLYLIRVAKKALYPLIRVSGCLFA